MSSTTAEVGFHEPLAATSVAPTVTHLVVETHETEKRSSLWTAGSRSDAQLVPPSVERMAIAVKEPPVTCPEESRRSVSAAPTATQSFVLGQLTAFKYR